MPILILFFGLFSIGLVFLFIGNHFFVTGGVVFALFVFLFSV